MTARPRQAGTFRCSDSLSHHSTVRPSNSSPQWNRWPWSRFGANFKELHNFTVCDLQTQTSACLCIYNVFLGIFVLFSLLPSLSHPHTHTHTPYTPYTPQTNLEKENGLGKIYFFTKLPPRDDPAVPQTSDNYLPCKSGQGPSLTQGVKFDIQKYTILTEKIRGAKVTLVLLKSYHYFKKNSIAT